MQFIIHNENRGRICALGFLYFLYKFGKFLTLFGSDGLILGVTQRDHQTDGMLQIADLTDLLIVQPA